MLRIAYTPGATQVSRANTGNRTPAARYSFASRLVAVGGDDPALSRVVPRPRNTRVGDAVAWAAGPPDTAG